MKSFSTVEVLKNTIKEEDHNNLIMTERI